MVQELQKEIISVEKLLTYCSLTLPIYQRPYKWNATHVSQLIEDIYHFSDRKAYRLGTIVIHTETNENNTSIHNIVDGQQRTITLLLIAKAIISNKANYKNPILLNKLKIIDSSLISFEIESPVSKSNIQQNYRNIKRLITRLDEKQLFFFFEKCELVQFILSDITEAFQFFDAQNARGKDLDPHDLLKAFHLREFSQEDMFLQNQIVNQWENTQSEELSKLFSEYLYRVKGWAKGNSSRYFSKKDIKLFKGIKIDETESYPYTIPLRIAHFFTDDYNRNIDRKIDNNRRDFPFQLDQTIINGRRFFEFINYYKRIIDSLYLSNFKEIPLDDNAKKILKCIQNYPSMHRTGDKYTRALFDCALIFYIDKFEYNEISRVIEKIFIWAYSIRLNYQNLQFASIDNYVLIEKNIFKIISTSITPHPVVNLNLNNVENIKASKVPELIKLFKELNYYDK